MAYYKSEKPKVLHAKTVWKMGLEKNENPFSLFVKPLVFDNGDYVKFIQVIRINERS